MKGDFSLLGLGYALVYVKIAIENGHFRNR